MFSLLILIALNSFSWIFLVLDSNLLYNSSKVINLVFLLMAIVIGGRECPIYINKNKNTFDEQICFNCANIYFQHFLK